MFSTHQIIVSPLVHIFDITFFLQQNLKSLKLAYQVIGYVISLNLSQTFHKQIQIWILKTQWEKKKMLLNIFFFPHNVFRAFLIKVYKTCEITVFHNSAKSTYHDGKTVSYKYTYTPEN